MGCKLTSMAADFSFDIVSRVDQQEVRNAVDQAQKELANRWDLKNTNTEIEFEKDNILLRAGDEGKLAQVRDILLSKLIKRGVDSRQVEWGKEEAATGLTVKQDVKFKTGIAMDQAKALVKKIKDSGVKVNAQIQGEEVRCSSKNKDDLQKAIQHVKGLDLDYPVDFVNFR